MLRCSRWHRRCSAAGRSDSRGSCCRQANCEQWRPPAHLASELARIAPSEVLIADAWSEALAPPCAGRRVTQARPDWHFDLRSGESLQQLLQVATLDAFAVTDAPEILAAASALLDYARSTQGGRLPHVAALHREAPSDFLLLDAVTRRNLEITETLRGEDGPTLFRLLDHCETGMGSRRLRHWLHHPLRPPRSPCATSFDRGAARRHALHDSLRDALRGLPDLERISTRITLRSVRPRELAALRDALPAVERVVELLAAGDAPLLAICGQCQPPPTSLNAGNALHPEPAHAVRDGDVIGSGHDAELDELRALRDNTGQFLVDLEQRERARTGIANLRVEYNRVHGFYIEVTHGQAAKVPDDYRRRQTLKNAERYITPNSSRSRTARSPRANAPWRARRRYSTSWSKVSRPRTGAAGGRRRPCGAGCPGCARAPCTAGALGRTRTRRARRHRDTRSAPCGRRARDRSVRAERLRAAPGPTAAGHHRPEHGRQVDLHALDRADRTACLRGKFRPGRERTARSGRSDPDPDRSRRRPGARPLDLHGGNDGSGRDPQQRDRDAAWC